MEDSQQLDAGQAAAPVCQHRDKPLYGRCQECSVIFNPTLAGGYYVIPPTSQGSTQVQDDPAEAPGGPGTNDPAGDGSGEGVGEKAPGEAPGVGLGDGPGLLDPPSVWDLPPVSET